MIYEKPKYEVIYYDEADIVVASPLQEGEYTDEGFDF